MHVVICEGQSGFMCPLGLSGRSFREEPLVRVGLVGKLA